MKKDYIVKQQDIKDCGICSLESIIKYYGGYIPLEQLRLDTRTNKNGTTALNLIKTAKKYGFSAYGRKDLKISSNEIILPAIAHTITNKGINHFVTIYKISDKYIYLMDPASGYKKVAKEEFIKEWTNIILIFKPYKKIPLYKLKNNLKKLFYSLIIQEKKLIKKLIISSIIYTIITIIISYYLKILITSIETNYISTTYIIMVIFLLINILKIYFSHLRNKLTIYINKNIDLSIIPDFISHIFNLPLNVINSRTSGEILTRIKDLYNIKELFSEIIITILLDLILCISSSYFLYYISSELFLILCIISVLYIIVGLILNPIIVENINDNIESETEFNSYLSEEISLLETTKNLNLTTKKINLLSQIYTKYERSLFNHLKQLNIIETLKNTINDLGLFIITSYGIYLVSIKKIDLISLFTFLTLISYFLDPIISSISLLPRFNLIKLSLNKINEFLNLESERVGEIKKLITGDIKFENITYSYDNYHNILNNITLNIKENSHNLMIGPTGSGKTTLFKMLNLNINDYKGNISINNINIKDYSLNTLRKNILYISQREKLYTDTIYNNIVLSKYIDKKELQTVLKITKVDEIINKKELRLESILYDEGFNLSGGERQRIILARSILMHPKILIMDESLSEVDKDTETNILLSIDKYLKNTTIIYITHTETKCFNNVIRMQYKYD